MDIDISLLSARPEDALDYESNHVHEVYEQIASHFSATRYKVSHFQGFSYMQDRTEHWQPWPVVDRFLHELPLGSIGLDVGCGNGKYLGARDGIYIVGSDR